MKDQKLFRLRATLFVLMLITTTIFITGSASAHRPGTQRAYGSKTALQSLPAELTAKDWDQITRSIQSTFDQQSYLKASNVDPNDYFGFAVAISGDTLVVGAYAESGNGSSGEGDNSVPGAGAAYVFVRSGTSWVQQAYLKASNVSSSNYFGWSVAISGDTIVVGAPNENLDGNDTVYDAGAAYAFVREGTAWTQQAYLKASNLDSYDQFGYSVAISGDTVVVGAPYEDGDGSSGEGNNDSSTAGAAYVFVREGTTWTQQAYLKASNVDANDYFGWSVAISVDTLVVGADGEDGDGSDEGNDDSSGAGAAYVFVREGTTWSQQAYLKASNVDAFDFFGWSVAISGDTLVVGARYEAGNGSSGEGDNSAAGAGAAYVFVRDGTSWSQQAYLKASNVDSGDYFGWSVAISGGTIVVGALNEDGNGISQADNSALNTGAAYVFVRGGTAWTQQAYLKASNIDDYDNFGWSVAISGDTLVVGAYAEDGNGISQADNSISDAGAAYVFHRFQVYLPLLMR